MKIKKIPAKQIIIELKSNSNTQFFLLDGSIRVNDATSTQWLIHARTENARNPLSKLRPSRYHVESETPVKLIIFDIETLIQFSDKSSQINTAKKIKQHPLYKQLITDLHNDQLKLPSIPDVAIKIRQALADDKSDAHHIAHIISSDPAITTKIIKTSNSALYRSVKKITDCQMAVTRLGTKVTSQLVTAFSMQELFNTKNKLLQKKMNAIWNHSREIAALSFVLAKITPGFDPEHALLAGLLHDIGTIPIIGYADKHPEIIEDQLMFEQLIEEIKGEVGAAILSKWGFSDHIVTSAREAEMWLRQPGEKPQYCDIIIIAQLHAMVGKPQTRTHADKQPQLDQVPAFSKLALGQLTPEMSVDVLKQAHDQIQQTLNLL